ncbi:PRAME family member 9/15 [Heterocephalus glaber]|uniref:PRAME family member 9/15 n=1 Tax=Heterocephalus glaber TaxID=10181 RepID=G5BDA4_HETGA|nr:PRAME family member 9/15 [Heterocephalus glaber]
MARPATWTAGGGSGGGSRFFRMTTQSPLTLYELNKQSRLNSETTASTALHDLPSMIFHVIFMEAFMGEHYEVLKWARKRKASVHLSCEKVMIKSSAVFTVLKLLRAVHLDSIQELDVFSDWTRESMKAFVPHLKKMTNLHTFHFSSLSPEVFTSASKNKWQSRIYAFHLGQRQNLWELHIDDVFFLEGTLHKIFRSQTPLEALSLSSSPLKESDLKHLAHCILQVLLHECSALSQLTQGVYPAPLESYESKIPTEFVHPEKFHQVCAKLAPVLMDIRPSLLVQICTYSCDWCMLCQFYTLEPSGNWEITEEYRLSKLV